LTVAAVTVKLREITADTVRQITDLEVGPGQNSFVAPNAVSIAQAYFEPKAWFRAIYADNEPVGFVMLYDDSDKPEYYLWRLMIADGHQRQGYGRRAIELLVDYVRTRPKATELLTSYVPTKGGPEPFYRGLGFIDTGKIDDGEVVIKLAL
jgi:diamine N-acetyltransferase